MEFKNDDIREKILRRKKAKDRFRGKSVHCLTCDLELMNYHGDKKNQIYKCKKCGDNFCKAHKNPKDHKCHVKVDHLMKLDFDDDVDYDSDFDKIRSDTYSKYAKERLLLPAKDDE